ncbi:30S ribosomal protein S18 [Chloroflexota bacterium]
MARRKPSNTKKTDYRRSRYTPSRKVCAFCAGKIKTIDYKDAEKLRGFITDRAKIAPRRRTGTCARHQRTLAIAIKRARHLALLPYVPAHMRRGVSIGVAG